MNQVVISGAGLWKPEHVVTNEELVAAYNAFETARDQSWQPGIQVLGLAEGGLTTIAAMQADLLSTSPVARPANR